MNAELAQRVKGPVFTAGDAGYAEEIAGANTVAELTPEVVVGATSAEDVVEAVRFARKQGWTISVQGAGHGGLRPIRDGLLVSTRRLDHVRIDRELLTASIGAGARWGAVIAAAAEHGLAPIAGSSVMVGVVGYLLGGGLGPLARSHGFGSDYLVSATVVTPTGEVVEASAESHTELLWALRGGKDGLGIVTELRIKLVALSSLYAGSLTFDEPHIEAALRAWIDYTGTADPQVSTSAAIANLPDIEKIPAPIRGKRLLSIRFAYPGDADEGARLAAPLRAAAPIFQDALAEMPVANVGAIHNDPTEPGPAWVVGAMLTHADQAFATTLLRHVGMGTSEPFVAVEVRHLGNATARDVPEGSAVGGRSANFALSVIGVPDPALFATVIPEAAKSLRADLAPWTSSDNNANFIGEPADPMRIDSAWSLDNFARLEKIRRRYATPAT